MRNKEKYEFSHFMKDQVRQIKNYCKDQAQCHPGTDPNLFAFEWIEKYSEEFRRRWETYNHKHA